MVFWIGSSVARRTGRARAPAEPPHPTELEQTVAGSAPSIINLDDPSGEAKRLPCAIVLRPPAEIEQRVRDTIGLSPFDSSIVETRATEEGAYSTVVGVKGTTATLRLPLGMAAMTAGWNMEVVQDLVRTWRGQPIGA